MSKYLSNNVVRHGRRRKTMSGEDVVVRTPDKTPQLYKLFAVVIHQGKTKTEKKTRKRGKKERNEQHILTTKKTYRING